MLSTPGLNEHVVPDDIPEYTASLMFELYRTNGTYGIKVAGLDRACQQLRFATQKMRLYLRTLRFRAFSTVVQHFLNTHKFAFVTNL